MTRIKVVTVDKWPGKDDPRAKYLYPCKCGKYLYYPEEFISPDILIQCGACGEVYKTIPVGKIE